MTNLTLISHDLCPYVQRAAIALVEKEVPFERVNVDLANKPDWFVAISPLGKAPLLKVGTKSNATVIFESSVILEYLEDTQPNKLYPQEALERARHRSWIEFGSAMLNAIARLYGARDQAGFEKEINELGRMADLLEAELQARGGGPWFAGSQFGLVDSAFAPAFRYFDSFEAEAGLRLLDDRPAIASWRRMLASRPSAQTAVAPDYPVRLKQFLLSRDSVLSSRIAA